jgi:hypothetical protein
MAKSPPKVNPDTAPIRKKGPKRPPQNSTKSGKINGNWQPGRKK